MAARLRWMTRSIAVMPPNQGNKEMTKLIERNLIDAGKPTCRVVSAAAEFPRQAGTLFGAGNLRPIRGRAGNQFADRENSTR